MIGLFTCENAQKRKKKNSINAWNDLHAWKAYFLQEFMKTKLSLRDFNPILRYCVKTTIFILFRESAKRKESVWLRDWVRPWGFIRIMICNQNKTTNNSINYLQWRPSLVIHIIEIGSIIQQNLQSIHCIILSGIMDSCLIFPLRSNRDICTAVKQE